MAIRNLYATATNITGIKSILLTEGMSQNVVQIEITATGHSQTIGGSCEVDMGYTDEHAVVISSGIVKDIRTRVPQHDYVITVHDILSRAVEYFIAPDNPDGAYRANNISAENLVRDLLAMAQITSYTGEASGFTFGVQQNNDQNKILLVTAMNAIENICRITGCLIYADAAGLVHFSTRKPYIVGGDTSEHDFTGGSSGDLLHIEYLKSSEKLRNRVVCYGAPGISAVASAASPYLPASFSKTLVIAHELLDNFSQAQRACDINLEMFNRLTETCSVSARGKPGVRARDIVSVTDSFCGLTASDLWVVFATKHTLSTDGYSMDITLVR